MSLQGLPDFFQPIQAEAYVIYYPFEKAGPFLVAPAALEIADRPDGSPDFLLELVRGVNPSFSPYGRLDVRLQPRYQLSEALLQLRDRYPDAMVNPLLFASGFLRLQPGEATTVIPEDLQAPVSLSWNGLGTVRFSLKLSMFSALLLKQALQEAALPLTACAEMELLGVAPRLPLQVRFNPAALLSAIAATADSERRVARPALVRWLRQHYASLPWEITGEVTDEETLAETLADWIRAYWGSLTPSPQSDGNPYLQLATPEPAGSSVIEWNLAQPIATWRPLVLYLNPLQAARAAIAQGLTSLVRSTTVPTFSTGVLPVSVSANLPLHRPGVEAVGVTLRAAPKLPYRPQAAIETLELNPPDDAAIGFLHLSPVEPPNYTATTFIVVSDSQGVRKFKGAERSAQGATLYLGPSDFAVRFITLEAFPDLLEIADLQGVCRWQEAGVAVERSVDLNRQQPTTAMALPANADGATLTLTARSLETGATLSLSQPARSLKLGLHSFREYGPQQVQIACLFSEAVPVMAIDLLPEGRPETPAEISVLFFTPNQTQKTWTYLARSPFQSGYRYRMHADAGQPLQEWSAVQPARVPLTISTQSQPVSAQS